MSTERSWELTPREYDALVKVYEATQQRWGFERAEFRNAHQFKHPVKGQGWTADDFVDTPAGRLRAAQRRLEAFDLQSVQRAERRQMAAMQAGKFDDSQLPAWARMTPEEASRRKRK